MLLDTQAFLWFALGDARLSGTAKALISAPDKERLVSPATYWEIAIKISVGKYTLTHPYESFIDQAIRLNGFAILPIEPKHTAMLTTLPYHHRDPFDRLLIAQALVENVLVVSNDRAFDAYTIARIW